jgi:SAM-dependent methyltransferase
MTSRPIDLPNFENIAIGTAPDFNRLARIYRWMEWLAFGPFLQRCRCASLSSLAERRRALVLGDGDGRFTACLLRSNATIKVDVIDASQAMLRQLASRSPAARIRTHLADARTFTPARRDYDLIATHFFLDCLSQSEVSDLASRVCHHATPDAIWIISEFAVPSNFYGRTIAAPLIRALYFAFGLLTRLQVRTLPDHHAALARSGWSLLDQRKILKGLLVSELWQLEARISESNPA